MNYSTNTSALIALGHVDELRTLARNREQARVADPTSMTGAPELKGFGERLFAKGGLPLMVATYDQAIDSHGYRAVFGVSAAWTGVGGWAA